MYRQVHEIGMTSNLFAGAQTFSMNINGEMNGAKFTVSVTGDKVKDGHLETLAVCDSGDLPFSWVALANTLNYGYFMFAQYPQDGIDFFKECFPEGMTMTRTQTFDDGGVITSTHVYKLECNNVHAEVTFKGEGFDSEGPVMQKTIAWLCPAYLFVAPNTANSVKVRFFDYYQIDGGKYLTATCESICTSAKAKQRMPKYHQLLVQTKQREHAVIKKDHIAQEEYIQYRSAELDMWTTQ